MNFIYLSPHFPPNYYAFSVALRQLGVNVLGLADEPYDHLRSELRQALGEYYRVNDMHNPDELTRAVGYLTYRHGKIDRIESLNEYWLETEARLRTDFNIDGLKNADMPRIKRKSAMKKVFAKAGVRAARGRVTPRLVDAKRLADEVGYPLVAKPDIGVGAARTYKLHSPAELEQFFAQKPPIDYILEEFIQGAICSFDGLTDRSGSPVFYTSHQFSQGIMETVNDDALIYYYSLRQIPPDLEQAGMRVLHAFEVRERFFHFEFFRTPDGGLTALEVNMRPPGGLTTDMFNYANDFDIYKEWASVVAHNRFTAEYSRPYHCAYIGRKYNRPYALTHAQVLARLGSRLVQHEPINGVFSAALGDYGYVVRSPDLDEILEMAEVVQRGE